MDLGHTRPDEGQFCSRVKDAYKSVSAIFEQEHLKRLEGLVAAVEDPWLTMNGAGAPAAEEQLLHLAARWAHIAQHGEQLRGFAGALAEIEQSQSSINYPELQQAPSNSLRLQRLEARGALLARAAAKLHEDVSTVAEDYHSAMTELSAQFLAWDAALERRIAARQ
ncbi:unnamed protein product [Prorocentrum cordatum]|uniref:Uncharacterized protein n=1 Tax=Prorocentrum cordatum TaxID=2364126 RepID=A0ABN9T8Y4_9DINO|nr:unnamed protein product [Polarella glacialis]